MGYHRLNDEMAPLAAGVCAITAIIKAVVAYMRDWHAVIDLVRAFMSISLWDKDEDQFVFKWNSMQDPFTELLQRYHNSPATCHHLQQAQGHSSPTMLMTFLLLV